MIVSNQSVRMNWSNRNRKYYENLGYTAFENGKEFSVSVEHLPLASRAIVEVICDYCGKSHTGKYSSKSGNKNHFCSRKCQDSFLIGKPTWNKKDKIKLNCSYCDIVMERDGYDIKRSKNLFCSKDCSDLFKIGKGNKRVERFRVNCDNCNSELERTEVELNRGEKHFCNKKCSDEYFKGRPNLRNRNGKIVNCYNCNEVFHLARYRIESQERYFCSNDCRIEWTKSYEFSKVMQNEKGNIKIKTHCKECGVEFEKKPSEFVKHGFHYCSRNCIASYRLKEKNPNPKKDKIKVCCYTCNKEKFVNESIFKKNKYFFCSSFCYQEKRIEISDFKQTGTRIHLDINKLLNDLNISYKNEKSMGYYSIDIFLDKYNLCIEIMGDYWHGSPLKYNDHSQLNEIQLKNIKRDRVKNKFINSRYKTKILYLWETDINKNVELCKELINEFVDNKGNLVNYNSFNYDLNDGRLELVRNITPYWNQTVI